MQNEIEQHLKQAGSETPVSVPKSVQNAGVVAHHESDEMAQIDTSHDGLLSPSKAAVPVPTEAAGLVILPEPVHKPRGKPMEDTTWGIIPMAHKLREKLLRRQKKGKLQNAA